MALSMHVERFGSGVTTLNVEKLMKTKIAKTQINTLWHQFRVAVNAAYDEANKSHDQDGICLRDYAENIPWSDSLASLLGREAANERQHRRNRPSPSGFSVDMAAKLILLDNAAKGAAMSDMPRATSFLVLRRTAVEAEIIGFLARKYLSAEWRAAVSFLDYVQLMKGGQQ
jgi:hypothetical protein